MTLADKQLARVSDRLMKEDQGIGYFKLSHVAMIQEEYMRGEKMDFWDGVEAIYGSRDGVTYLRFRNGDDPNGMPDFTLVADSPARGKGIDLSIPFTIAGKTFDPLPGMKPGYFSGTAPDCGALQYSKQAGP